jgi:hypothetical protein
MSPNPPKPTGVEMSYTTKAYPGVETLVKRIGDAPEKFTSSNEAIGKLFTVYTKVHSFSTKPSGTIDSFTATAKLLDEEFRSSARTLKSGLPEKISDKLNESKKKYKALQDF